MPFIPSMVPSLSLTAGTEVYARRRGTTFMDSSMDKYWYAEPVPAILLAMLPGGRYLVVLSDQDEIVVLNKRQVWKSVSRRPHRLAPE
jgi:hypothetical protein